MDELLKEARHENPLLNSKEVENVIRNGRSASPESSRGFIHHIGARTLMVTIGVLIVSLIAYTVMKPGKKEMTGNEAIENSNNNVSALKNMPTVATQPIADATVSNNTAKIVPEAIPADKINKANPATENKKSVEKKSPESNLSASISSVKISESFNMVSEKGNAVSDGTDKKAMSKKVKISFDYNGEKVRMKFSGDDLKELSLDNQPVAAEKFDEYNLLISEARKLVHQKAGSSRSGKKTIDDESSNLNLVQFFNTQLHNDQIVSDGTPYSFELTASQLLINKSAQSAEQFQKYKKLYETKTGKMLTAGSEYAFEKSGKKN